MNLEVSYLEQEITRLRAELAAAQARVGELEGRYPRSHRRRQGEGDPGMSDRRFETYLGDGAYVYLDPYGGVVLYTSDGINETNRVVLEPEVLSHFRMWVEQARTED